MSMAERCGICHCHQQMAQRLSYCNGSMSLRVRGQTIGEIRWERQALAWESSAAFSSREGEIPYLNVQQLTARGGQA
ncbi:hypothetical protein AVEN_181421-1 [Araneus ventricosus]|uniref:Uncharacterized protein n=1 Tax=Araneus ventricosus TaxID=182803 RepID=A0A4Y2SBT5_ARAVE|nr:hypothetical protein AVEN_181421-1 [Araneus ventricosus]